MNRRGSSGRAAAWSQWDGKDPAKDNLREIGYLDRRRLRRTGSSKRAL